VQLNPSEHDDASWLGVEKALATLPYAGLRRAVQLAVAARLS